MTMGPTEPDERFCRFCKEVTKQWVDTRNDHNRVCLKCWRKKDGEQVEIQDGYRMSGPPRRDSRPPSVPPAPPIPSEEYALRTDLNDALRRIASLEHQMHEVRSTTQLFERIGHVEGSNGSR